MNMVPTGSGSDSATLSKTIQNTKQVRHKEGPPEISISEREGEKNLKKNI
jgi:hypothetical protein